VQMSPSQYLKDSTSDPADMYEKSTLSAANSVELQSALKKLDDRSRDIIRDRWLSDGKHTLHELAERYNISTERVRQIEQNAMKKIRRSMSLN